MSTRVFLSTRVFCILTFTEHVLRRHVVCGILLQSPSTFDTVHVHARLLRRHVVCGILLQSPSTFDTVHVHARLLP